MSGSKHQTAKRVSQVLFSSVMCPKNRRFDGLGTDSGWIGFGRFGLAKAVLALAVDGLIPALLFEPR